MSDIREKETLSDGFKDDFCNKYKMPAISRTFKEIETRYEKMIIEPKLIYTKPEIKGNGSMLVGNKKVVITDFLAEKFLTYGILEQIKMITMPEGKTYLIKEHNGIRTTGSQSNLRQEELVALNLFNKEKYLDSDIDSFIDYQVPICRDSKNKESNIGKIDLVSISEKKKEIYLMELKKYGSKESLLRCTTEIYTYFKQIDKIKLIKEVVEKNRLESAVKYKVVPTVLVFEGKHQHLQFRSGLLSNVQKLMKKIGVRFFVITSSEPYNSLDFSRYINNCKIKELPVHIMEQKTEYVDMKLAEKLDESIIKEVMKANSDIKSGYKIGDKKFYPNYLSKESFNEFKDKMSDEARKMYGEGSGSELEERKDNSGNFRYPPKMASFGSSSRMIYELSKNVGGFVYEKKFPTTIGGTAHLDGFLEKDNEYIFVEAKCREPYCKKSKKVDEKYKDFYIYLNDSGNTKLFCQINLNNKNMEVDFKYNGETIQYFDIKQMICHLLGIGTWIFKEKDYQYKHLKFIYLVFSPCFLEFEDEEIKKEILNIYFKICNECEKIKFDSLFKVILEYLNAKYYPEVNIDIIKIVESFSVVLSCQHNYKEELEN